ncbi:MAG: putative aminohydrolase SsnA [Anaerolineales bacterium]|nr:putative aminohydrolase SsnA [Anaerolineales bacterium]
MLIINAKIITWGLPNEIIEGVGIHINEGKIFEVGPSKMMLEKHPEDETLDAGGQYVMPGNICAHTHFYGAFARGMAIPGSPPKDFPEILKKLWWPLDKSLTEEDVRYSTLVSLVDAIKHGTTTLIDHHASPNALAGSLDAIAEEVDRSGLRAVLCYEVTDRDGEQKALAGIEENVRFINRCKDNSFANGRIAATFGLHASLTLSEKTLEKCRDLAPEGTGFHIHVAEHESDQNDSLKKSGLRVVDRLHRHKILGSRTIVAHAIHVDAREVGLLADTGTWVTHQPRSNMNNAVGAARVDSMMRAGVHMGLGNDGFANAMWEEWKTAYLLQKVVNRDPQRLQGNAVVEMAVYNNAELAGMFFDKRNIGRLEPGAVADLIFVDYYPTTPLTADNLPWHILFGFHESMITTTIVDGRVLMRDRKLLTLDEERITARSRELAEGVWERYRSFVPKE